MVDGTESQVDVETSPETKGTSKTYTEEQTTELVRKAKSDALADVGRLKKSAEDALARLNKMVKDQEVAEEETHKDDEPELRRIRSERARREAESNLESERSARTELEEKLRQIDAEKVVSTKERNAREIATRLGVDAGKLGRLAKFTDGTPEAIEDIARDLPKVTEGKPSLKTDSGRTLGGSPQTVIQVQEDYIKGKINNVQYAEKMKALGQQP